MSVVKGSTDATQTMMTASRMWPTSSALNSGGSVDHDRDAIAHTRMGTIGSGNSMRLTDALGASNKVATPSPRIAAWAGLLTAYTSQAATVQPMM